MQRTRFQPRFDSLEDRHCLSVSVGLSGGDPSKLVIKGDNTANEIAITQNDVTNDIEVK